MDWNIKNKVAIVTGGGAGIGSGLATGFYDAGCKVVIVDKDSEKISELQSQQDADQCLAIEADISDPASAQKVLDATLEYFGQLDILVNNAGIYPCTPVLEMELEEWQEVISTNLTGSFAYSKIAAKHFVDEHHGGKIVNISSCEIIKPVRVGYAHYEASKAGIVAFTKSLALEVAGKNINVNSVAPAGVPTQAFKEMIGNAEILAQIEQGIPAGRFGTLQDIANAVLYLSSPLSDYVHGSVVFVDGGFLLS